jgi:protein ImuB
MALTRRCDGRSWPTDRPLALVIAERGVLRLTAINGTARAAGVSSGLALTDARAILPELVIHAAEPEEDAKALAALALWAQRWSPRVAADGADGLILDLAGCSHLFGGEAGLLADVAERFRRLGLEIGCAIADSRLAAWGWARFGAGGILTANEAAAALAGLSVQSLRLLPETVAILRRLGLRRVGQLTELPRAALLRRFGGELPSRLDQLMGSAEPPFVPLREPPRFAARHAFAEPIGRTEDVETAVRHLLDELCRMLEDRQAALCRLRLGLYRVDATIVEVELGTARPVRDPAHLFQLARPRLDGLDMGFGIELILAEAVETAPFTGAQPRFSDGTDTRELARLLDRLAVRLGSARVLHLQPRDSHWPERATRLCPATAAPDASPWCAASPRPLRLHGRPRPIEVLAEAPEGPPAQLMAGRATWRIVHATGPERLLPEWWREEDATTRLRDYYRLLTEDGRLLWVYREGRYSDPAPPRWWLHGLFG